VQEGGKSQKRGRRDTVHGDSKHATTNEGAAAGEKRAYGSKKKEMEGLKSGGHVDSRLEDGLLQIHACCKRSDEKHAKQR